MATLAFAAVHLGMAAGLALVAVALGRRIAAIGGPALRDARWGLPLALGLGAIACGAALLLAAGAMTLPAILLLLAIGVAIAAPEWRRLAAAARALASDQAPDQAAGQAAAPRRAWPLLAVLAGGLPAALLALYPPTGFDALLYHLPAAARFAASGRIAVAPDLRFPAFTWLNEVLFAVALRLGDDVLAQCLGWVAWLGTAALLWEGCGRRYGRRAGALAAALWLGDPLGGWLASSAYVEPLVALFVLAAIEALDRAVQEQAPRALLLAGALAGCAAATKYQGLLAVALVALVALAGRLGTPFSAPAGAAQRDGSERATGGAASRPRKAAGLSVAPALLVAAAVALPWYVWIGVSTGDPLFPVLTRLWHHGAAAGPGPAVGWAAIVHPAPGAGWVRSLWPYPPGSPLLWLLWPLPLLGWRRAPAAARPAAAGLGMGLLVAASHPDARRISVVTPLFAAAIAASASAWAAAGWGVPAAAPRLLALALAALLPGWLYAAQLAARRGPLPDNGAQRQAYLARQLPGFAALAWLNTSCGGRCTTYGLFAEDLRYYAAGRYLGDFYGAAPFRDVVRAAARPPDLHALLSRLGVDHLLVRRGAADPDLAGPWFRAVYRDREAAVWALTPDTGRPRG